MEVDGGDPHPVGLQNLGGREEADVVGSGVRITDEDEVQRDACLGQAIITSIRAPFENGCGLKLRVSQLGKVLVGQVNEFGNG